MLTTVPIAYASGSTEGCLSQPHGFITNSDDGETCMSDGDGFHVRTRRIGGSDAGEQDGDVNQDKCGTSQANQRFVCELAR